MPVFYIKFHSFINFDFLINQSAEVEHADILELNTVIDALRMEKEEVEKEKVSNQYSFCFSDCVSHPPCETLPPAG